MKIRENKTKQINLKITDSQFEKLQKLAKENDMKNSEVFFALLEKGFLAETKNKEF
jgi:hypothetical protein